MSGASIDLLLAQTVGQHEIIVAGGAGAHDGVTVGRAVAHVEVAKVVLQRLSGLAGQHHV